MTTTAEPIPVNEIRLALTILIRAMVDEPEKVEVVASTTTHGTTFHVTSAFADAGYLVGGEGRNARALRVILLAAARRYQTFFGVDLNGRSSFTTARRSP